MSEAIKNGEMNVMGINIDISQVLGEKIIDQYLAQLKEEDMETLLKYISSDLFTEYTDYSDPILAKRLKVSERKKIKNSWGEVRYETDELTLGELVKNRFNKRIKEELMKKIEEIVASDDYKEKINSIAEEIVEYSINGYKEDLKAALKQKLVHNVLDPEPMYGGQPLSILINQIIDERFR